MTDIHTCPAHGVVPCVTCLRAEHQRLKDAVVAAAMKLKLWADDPNHSEAGTTLRFELYQECTALAAFEAQHPEVRG